MFQKKKFSDTKNFDNNFRVFPKVLALKNLNWTEKIVLSYAISFQIHGQDFRCTSKHLSEMFDTSDSTIDKTFTSLERKGYITRSKYNNGKHLFNLREVDVIDVEKFVYKDEYLTSINWKTSTKIDPKQTTSSSLDKETIRVDLSETPDSHHSDEKSKEPDGIIEDSLVSLSPIQQVTSDDEFDVRVYLTPKKLEWAEKLISRNDKDMKKVTSMGYSTIQEMLYDMDKQAFNDFFYNDNGVWYNKKSDKNGCDEWENIHGINYYYQGAGARISIFKLNENGNRKDSFQLNKKDLEEYLQDKTMVFGQLTTKDLNILKQKEKQPLKMY